EVMTKRLLVQIVGMSSRVTALAFSEDGTFLAVGWANGVVQVHRLTPRPEKVGDGSHHNTAVTALAAAPKGQGFASGDDSGPVGPGDDAGSGGVTGGRSVPIVVVVVVRSTRSNTSEAGGAVRIATQVMRHLRMRTERPLELHSGRVHVVRRVLRRDESLRRFPVLDPILDRDLHVVQGVPHGGHLPGSLSSDPCTGPARAVPHPGDHEQAVELLRLLHPTHRVR